jgi:hypothetical protein
MKTFREYLEETSSWKDKKGVDKKKPWSQQVRDSVEKERKRLEKIKNTKGYDAYLKAIKESEETELEEMADSEEGRKKILSYLHKRVPQIANTAAEDGLEAGTYHKHKETVVGRNPETGEPIYAKAHKKHKIDKMIKGVSRAAAILAK